MNSILTRHKPRKRVNSMKKIAFVREFTVKENAEKFAEKKNGKVEKKYSWDYLKNRLVKKFVVKY